MQYYALTMIYFGVFGHILDIFRYKYSYFNNCDNRDTLLSQQSCAKISISPIPNIYIYVYTYMYAFI